MERHVITVVTNRVITNAAVLVLLVVLEIAAIVPGHVLTSVVLVPPMQENGLYNEF